VSIRSGSPVPALPAVIVAFRSVAAPTGAQTPSTPLVTDARLGRVPDHVGCIRRGVDGIHAAMVASRSNGRARRAHAIRGVLDRVPTLFARSAKCAILLLHGPVAQTDRAAVS
jgi:hypothetical protein